MELVDKKGKLLAVMLKGLALLINELSLLIERVDIDSRVHLQLVKGFANLLLIERVDVDGRVHVQLVKGFVNLRKFVANVSWVKGL